MSDLIIGTYLNLSNSHLSQRTCDRLDDYDGVLAHRTDCGWLMYVPMAQYDNEAAWPAELRPIVEAARASNCAYILFEADGPTTESLPTFDW